MTFFPKLIDIQDTVVHGVQTCNARTLHERLQVGRDFSTWIRSRLDKCRLKQDVHYWVGGNDDVIEFSPDRGKTPVGRPAIEYTLTVEAAMHVAMMEDTDIGYAVRDYFIEVSKRYHVLASQHQALLEQQNLKLVEDLAKAQSGFNKATKDAEEALLRASRDEEALRATDPNHLRAELRRTLKYRDAYFEALSIIDEACRLASPYAPDKVAKLKRKAAKLDIEH